MYNNYSFLILKMKILFSLKKSKGGLIPNKKKQSKIKFKCQLNQQRKPKIINFL